LGLALAGPFRSPKLDERGGDIVLAWRKPRRAGEAPVFLNQR